MGWSTFGFWVIKNTHILIRQLSGVVLTYRETCFHSLIRTRIFLQTILHAFVTQGRGGVWEAASLQASVNTSWSGGPNDGISLITFQYALIECRRVAVGSRSEPRPTREYILSCVSLWRCRMASRGTSPKTHAGGRDTAMQTEP